MNDIKLDTLIEETNQRGSLYPKDIPSLDLYMDQIMTLFDTYLNSHKRYENDKLITKTMINNYSKEGILKPIKGKKYSKEHIIQMLVIYSLKNTITIPEIKKVLAPFHQDTNKIEPIYQQYLEYSDKIIEAKSNELKEFIHHNHIENNEENLLSLLLLLSSLSGFYTSIAQKILDTYYQDK